MSEDRPASPARRPDNARPRSATPESRDAHAEAPHDQSHDQLPEQPPEPPTSDELIAVERQMLELTELSGATVETSAQLRALIVRRQRQGPVFNYIAGIRWPRDGWEALLAVAEQRFRAFGEWPSVLVAEGLTTPIDLAAQLERQRWVPLERETILWTRRAAVVPHLDPGLRVEAVTSRTAAAHEALEREVFELSEGTAEDRATLIARAIEAGRLRAFVIRLRGEPVAVTRLTARDGIAALYGVGVLRAYRGQGLGRLVTTIATRAALATGNRLVWLSVDEANLRARHLYASLDFQPAFAWTRLLGPEA